MERQIQDSKLKNERSKDRREPIQRAQVKEPANGQEALLRSRNSRGDGI